MVEGPNKGRCLFPQPAAPPGLLDSTPSMGALMEVPGISRYIQGAKSEFGETWKKYTPGADAGPGLGQIWGLRSGAKQRPGVPPDQAWRLWDWPGWKGLADNLGWEQLPGTHCRGSAPWGSWRSRSEGELCVCTCVYVCVLTWAVHVC